MVGVEVGGVRARRCARITKRATQSTGSWKRKTSVERQVKLGKCHSVSDMAVLEVHNIVLFNGV